jgi:hypothetical protein
MAKGVQEVMDTADYQLAQHIKNTTTLTIAIHDMTREMWNARQDFRPGI